MPHLHANGINLYYEEQGSGEPLILIMGFTVSSIGWRWNLPAFAQDFRTIAFDNRGDRTARDHGRNCERIHPPPAGVDGLESVQLSASSVQFREGGIENLRT